MKKWLLGKGITLAGWAKGLVGHLARFSTSRISERAKADVEGGREEVERFRRQATVDVLKASAAALERVGDRGVLVFAGWFEFGDWLGPNCGRCKSCGVGGRRIEGGGPCGFLPRMLGRFIVDGRIPMATAVALGFVVTRQGFELVGVAPPECTHICRSWVKVGQPVGGDNDAE